MLRLKIISPEKIEFEGTATIVTVPGTMGRFQILHDHAPLISSLEKGVVEYESDGTRHQLPLLGGFVEVQKNEVSLCVEVKETDELISEVTEK